MTGDSFINVAVALPVYGTYTYEVPEHFSRFTAVGKRVIVPFGRRRVTGYILNTCRYDGGYRVKKVLDVPDAFPLFPPSMILFFKWIADYYIHPLGDVIQQALPTGLNVSDSLIITITEKGREQLVARRNMPPLQQEILAFLQTASCTLKGLNRAFRQQIRTALMYSMEQQGWVETARKLHPETVTLKKERFVRAIPGDHDILSSLSHLTEKRKQLMDTIFARGSMPVADVKNIFPSADQMLKALGKEGLITFFQQPVYRDPFGERVQPDQPPSLTDEQQHAVAAVCRAIGRGFHCFLLAGVTGSGKTEVYLRIAAEALDKGFTALVLVPEIALISQTERRFRARFGECVAVLHSGLSKGERYDQWQRILRGETGIVIGARSAIFAPLENIGVVIVDEEHDVSYKQDSSLRYNARDLAVIRAKHHNGVVLLGSATPSIQACHNVEMNKFTPLYLKKRINQQPLPMIKVVDLREQKDTCGTDRLITPVLQNAITQALQRKEQTLLFLNRRGYATFPVCSACGQAIRCRHCDITLTYHKKSNAYKCHLCGFMQPANIACPQCGSSRIRRLGFGTEKIEKLTSLLYPQARIMRLDQDTTARKGAMLRILKQLRNNEIDILIGTQMLAKGHDFPNVTLVGILCADLSLSFPDFRAGERTFQLLAQVAGRAGRAQRSGRVILQTYNPEHFSIVAAQHQDYEEFYEQELPFRRALGYPPFSRLIQLKISGRDFEKTKAHARWVGQCCQELQQDVLFGKALEVLGPIEASLPRIAQRFRWQLLLKSQTSKQLHRFVRKLMAEYPAVFRNHQVKVAIDVDPMFMM
jgi:primosomal protein N' (replication factor Y)